MLAALSTFPQQVAKGSLLLGGKDEESSRRLLQFLDEVGPEHLAPRGQSHRIADCVQARR